MGFLSFMDSFVVVITLVVFVILVGVTGLTFSYFNNALQGADVDQQAKDAAEDMDAAWPGAMQWIFAGLLFGLPLVSMALAHINPIPPVFFYASLGLMLLMLVFAYAFRTAYLNIIANGGEFAWYLVSRVPLIDWVMQNFLLYSLLVVAIIGYGTYVKLGGVGYGGGSGW